MSVDDFFLNEYAKLNPEQQQAVDAIEGPVMVIAGPGTGKTQVLTLRIANILRTTDSEPDNILALTFTEAGVQAMRSRLSKLVGALAHRVRIATFHGFSQSLIESYPEYFPRIIGSNPATDVDQVSILEDILRSHQYEVLTPYGDVLYYLSSIRSALDTLKREGVSPEDLHAIVDGAHHSFSSIDDLYHDKGAHKGKMKGKYKDLERMIAKNHDLALVYERYQDELAKRSLYDFSDMITEVLGAFSREQDFLLLVQEQYHYVLVDEHQDTNNAQNRITEQLVNFHDTPNIFVVGDDKQSIFRFQGASLANFYYFKDHFKGAQVVELTTNYRSSQAILDATHTLAQSMKGDPVSLSAYQGYDRLPIHIHEYPNETEEYYAVARSIESLIQQGVPAEDIAVLYRHNRDVYVLSDVFRKLEIPFSVESQDDVYSHFYVKQFIDMLRAFDDFGDDISLAPVLLSPCLGFDPLDVAKVFEARDRKSFASLYELLKDDVALADLSLENPESFVCLYDQLVEWSKLSRELPLRQMIERVLSDIEYIPWLLQQDGGYMNVENFHAVFRHVDSLLEATPTMMISDYLMHLKKRELYGLVLKSSRAEVASGLVRCMTVHGSKGLEFEHVFMIRSTSRKWGDGRSFNALPLLPDVYALFGSRGQSLEFDAKEESLNDERRLFYVGLTRAKKSVVVTYSREGLSGRPESRCRFIDEIGEEHRVIEEHEAMLSGEELGVLMGSRVARPSESSRRDAFREHIVSLFQSQALSVSALNNYLKNPWQYVFRNLLRIPEVKTRDQAYGTSVHKAIERLFAKLIVGEDVGSEYILQEFTRALRKEGLPLHDYNDSLERAKNELVGWYDTYEGTWNLHILEEFFIRGVSYEGIALSGVLDKVEFIEGSDVQVNVVDYKTAAPKSRNDIMGNTRTSSGDMYRQLVFYKLLLDLYDDGRYQMVSGEIDFVRPSTSGVYKKEKFEIPDEDVATLKETILRVAEEITTLSFWDVECTPDTCDYCDLVEKIRRM